MLYKRLIINGKEYLLAVSQAGTGAPAATDPGSPGILYMDTDTGDLYKCTGGADGAWAWKKLSEGGSGYTLPVGGEQLGGVKNGGNVVINVDGTMTAPSSSQNANKPLNFTGAVSATYDGSEEVTVNIPVGGSGLTSTEKNHLLTILDGVIVETSKQSIITQALAALKQLWSGGEVYVSQSGTTLALENVTAVTTITQNGTVLALA
mgnify:CR=1 FL=1